MAFSRVVTTREVVDFSMVEEDGEEEDTLMEGVEEEEEDEEEEMAVVEEVVARLVECNWCFISRDVGLLWKTFEVSGVGEVALYVDEENVLYPRQVRMISFQPSPAYMIWDHDLEIEYSLSKMIVIEASMGVFNSRAFEVPGEKHRQWRLSQHLETHEDPNCSQRKPKMEEENVSLWPASSFEFDGAWRNKKSKLFASGLRIRRSPLTKWEEFPGLQASYVTWPRPSMVAVARKWRRGYP
jgi:hypothetical protein